MTIMIMICCKILIILNKNNTLKTTETKSEKHLLTWKQSQEYCQFTPTLVVKPLRKTPI